MVHAIMYRLTHFQGNEFKYLNPKGLILFWLFFFFRRMNKFEKELFDNVDSILSILGQKPKVTREATDTVAYPGARGDPTRPAGPELSKSFSETECTAKSLKE